MAAIMLRKLAPRLRLSRYLCRADQRDELAPPHLLPPDLNTRHRTNTQLCLEGISQYPLWVISGHKGQATSCPLYPKADVRAMQNPVFSSSETFEELTQLLREQRQSPALAGS